MVYNNYNSIVKNEISTASLLSLTRIKDLGDIMLRTSHNLINLIQTDTQVKMFMLANVPVIQDDGLYQPSYLFDFLDKFLYTSDYIDSIYLYSQASDFVISTNQRQHHPLKEFADQEWFVNYMRNIDESDIITVVRQGQDPYTLLPYNYITLIKVIRNLGPENAGAIIVNIDIDELGEIIEKANDKQIDDIFISDKNGVIIYNKDKAQININSSAVSYIQDLMTINEDYSVVKDMGENQQIISYSISRFNQWRYASVLPLKHFEQRLDYLRNFMLGFIGVSIFVAIIVAFFISMRAFNPIKNIISVIENPEKWADVENISDRSDFNEIMYITRNIANTFSKSKRMEQELVQRLMLLKNAQTAALQSQINPHFLYNTLGTINWMAIGLTKSDNEVSTMISSLSELLRLSLESGDNLIQISRELEHAQRYIEIQKVRYKNKFDVIWNIDHGILDYKVVKITLQPVIENAIYHGVKPKNDKCTIEINGYQDSKNIVFEIKDDGVGMSQERENVINTYINQDYAKPDNEHIGLKNVNQRFKLIFGEEYGITIKSELEKGTEVKIIIPVVK